MPTFDEWLDERGSTMLSFAWLVTRNRAQAHEVLQQALAELSGRFDRYTTIDGAEAHLKQMVTALAAKQPARAESAATAQQATVLDEVELVWQLGSQLTPVQRAAVALHYREELSFADVARTLEVSESAARSHVEQAMALVRTIVKEH